MNATAIEVTQKELAAFLGVTDRTLRNLRREIPPTGQGSGSNHVYNLAKAARAYLDYRIDQAKAKFTADDVAAARGRREIAMARKEEALAICAEVDARKAQEKVVEIEEVRREVESLFTNVKAKMRAIPNSLGSTMSGLLGQEKAIQIQTQMAEAIDRALGELARRSAPSDGVPCDASSE